MNRDRSTRFTFPFFYGWVIVIAAFIGIALTAGISNTQGVFFKPLLEDFGWTRATVAGAFALASIIAAMISPLIGQLADKVGPVIMVGVCGLFTGGTYLLLSVSNTLWQFYLILAIFMALGNSANFGSVGPTISRWFVTRRGLAQGIVQSGAGLGTIIFPPLATYLILTHNWRYAYVVLGLLILVLVGSMSFIYRRNPEGMGLRPDGKAPVTKPIISKYQAEENPPSGSRPVIKSFTLRQALASKSFRLLAFVAMASSFTQQLVLVHLVPHATDVGFSPAVAAIFMSVMGVSNISGKIVMGIVSDRIGRRNSLIISFSLAISMLFWLMVAHDTWAFYLFAVIYGFAYGSWIPMFPAIAGDLFGLGSLGAIYGAVMSSNSIGGAIGPFLAGYIFDITKSYNYAFLIAALLLITGIGALRLIHLPRPGEKTGVS